MIKYIELHVIEFLDSIHIKSIIYSTENHIFTLRSDYM